MKFCPCCVQTKPLLDFYKKCDTADGLTSRCKICVARSKKVSYEKHKEAVSLRSKKYHAENRNAILQRQKETYVPKRAERNAGCRDYYQRNKQKVRAANSAWDSAHPEILRKVWRDYKARNPEIRNALSAKRRAVKRNAYVRWDRELTDLVVKEAMHVATLRETQFGFSWDVDHVIPLSGKLVSGFHVWNNLQVIPASDNRSKSNKYEVSV